MKQNSLQFQLNDRFEFMQTARGFCALWVVLNHYLYGVDGVGVMMTNFTKNVDKALAVFFSVAGFVALLDVEKMFARGQTAVDYLNRRVARIYIPYLFAVVLAALIVPLSLALLMSLKHGFQAGQFSSVLIEKIPDYTFFGWIGILTLMQVFTADSWRIFQPFVEINVAAWFIAVIMQMYLVVTAAMLCRRFFYWILGIVTLVSYVVFFFDLKEYIPYGLFIVYWPQFSTGFILYALLRKGWRPAAPAYFYPLALIAYAALLGPLAYLQETQFYFALWVCGIFWFVYPFDKKLNGFPVFKLLAFIGVFSYSLYLIHMPLFPVLDAFARNFFSWVPVYPATLWILTPAAIVSSYFWYLLFEKRTALKRTSE